MTTGPVAFRAAAGLAADRLGPTHLRTLAERLATREPAEAVVHAVPVPGYAAAARAVLAALAGGQPPLGEAAAYLSGLADGMARQSDAVRVEAVWGGPSTHPVPVRATAQVLTELIERAVRELLLMTYSAKPYPPVLTALAGAADRGVGICVVVETLAGAGGAISGAEPAAAFAAVPGVALWHWPARQRATAGAKMHAKVAVADRRTMLVSSANLTESGVVNNLEAGLLVRGGTAPVRAAEHIDRLRADGVLAPLRVGV